MGEFWSSEFLNSRTEKGRLQFAIVWSNDHDFFVQMLLHVQNWISYVFVTRFTIFYDLRFISNFLSHIFAWSRIMFVIVALRCACFFFRWKPVGNKSFFFLFYQQKKSHKNSFFLTLIQIELILSHIFVDASRVCQRLSVSVRKIHLDSSVFCIFHSISI